MSAKVLLYNFNDQERLLRRYLNRAKIDFRQVQAPDFLHPLGYLFELPGFEKSARFNLGGSFSDEMLVMGGFTLQQQEDFLAFLRESHAAPDALKAVLTAVNRHWDSLTLHKELVREREAL